MLNSSVEKFSDMLASKAPVPGGGGASALAGALGIALGSMVCNLTIGKKKYAAYEEDIKRILTETEKIRKTLLVLVEKDAQVFEPLSRAYSLPTKTDEEKKTKEQIMETALKNAAEVPMKILKTLSETLDLLEILAVKGSKIAISDVGCAAALIRGAVNAAVLNVYINTGLMKDKAYAHKLNSEANLLVKESIRRTDEVYNIVEKGLI